MYVIALLGPFGAGKSTVAVNLVSLLASNRFIRSELALVINEAGGRTEVVTSDADVVILPNGCFTCQDEAVLIDVLRRLEREGKRIVIVEGFGIVSGTETRDFFEATPYPTVFLSVFDVSAFDCNSLLYSMLLPTHVSVADALIYTKCPTAPPDQVIAFVKEYNPVVPHEIGQVNSFPQLLWQKLLRMLQVKQDQVHHELCDGCDNHHHHHHQHQHQHDDQHGWETSAVDVRSSVTFSEFQAAAAPLVAQGVFRAKGRIGGVSFNVIPSGTTWEETPTGERGDFALCYMAQNVPWPVNLLELIQGTPEPARGYQLIRVDTHKEETVIELERGIAHIRAWDPHVRTLASGASILVTHPEELQVWKEMARRPLVKEVWFPRLIEACILYWVRCATWLQQHKTEVDHEHLPVHLRELAVSLAWWTEEYGAEYSQELRDLVCAVEPARMMVEGLTSITSLRPHQFWRYWQGVEYLRALRFDACLYAGALRGRIKEAGERIIALAQTQDEQEAFKREFQKE